MGNHGNIQKQIIGLVAALTLSACGGVSEFEAASSTTNVIDWASSEMSATTPVIADGITPSTITIKLRDRKSRPIKGYRPIIRVSGVLSASMSPCSVSDENGKSECWIKTHVPGIRTVHLDEPDANLQSPVMFQQMPAMNALYSIVSSGDYQALPNGHRIVSASGLPGAGVHFKDSNQVLRLKTSHFSALEEL